MTAFAPIDSIYDFTDKGLVELKAWLEPWFLQKPASFSALMGVHGLLVVMDGVGAELTTGIKGDVAFDFDCEITKWTALADQVGSIQADIWKDVFANYPPTVADTITGSAPPLLSSTDHNRSSALTGWTTRISDGDTLRFNIDSVSTVTRVTLVLKLEPV